MRRKTRANMTHHTSNHLPGMRGSVRLPFLETTALPHRSSGSVVYEQERQTPSHLVTGGREGRPLPMVGSLPHLPIAGNVAPREPAPAPSSSEEQQSVTAVAAPDPVRIRGSASAVKRPALEPLRKPREW